MPLETWTAGPVESYMTLSLTHRSLALEGIGEIGYVTAGIGPAVVLLHGLGASAIAWQENIAALSERHTVYAPDLPGHGTSAKPDVDYDLEYGVRFLEGFMDAVRLDRPAVVGNSMGGLMALATALRLPERASALVLVDSAGLGWEVAWPLRLVSLPVIGPILEATDLRLGLGFMRRLFHDPERIDPAVIQELSRLRRLGDCAAYGAQRASQRCRPHGNATLPHAPRWRFSPTLPDSHHMG